MCLPLKTFQMTQSFESISPLCMESCSNWDYVIKCPIWAWQKGFLRRMVSKPPVFEVCLETYSSCIASVRSRSYHTANARNDWTKPLRLLITPDPYPVWKLGLFTGVSHAIPQPCRVSGLPPLRFFPSLTHRLLQVLHLSVLTQGAALK